jgi:hypothetical protein
VTSQDCICWGRRYLKDRPRRNELLEVSASENRSSFRSNALKGYLQVSHLKSLGWVEGFEPSATGTTIQRSTS